MFSLKGRDASEVNLSDLGRKSTVVVRMSMGDNRDDRPSVEGDDGDDMTAFISEGLGSNVVDVRESKVDVRESLSNYVESIRGETVVKEEFEASYKYLGITEQELEMRINKKPYL